MNTPTCKHWPEPETYNEWTSYCHTDSYRVPDGGEPNDYCEKCGKEIEIIEIPHAENTTKKDLRGTHPEHNITKLRADD